MRSVCRFFLRLKGAPQRVFRSVAPEYPAYKRAAQGSERLPAGRLL